MGYSILEMVLRRLRDEEFIADIAYPGQKFPRITEPVAAVHIEKVDRAGQTVTVEVNIICPAAMGGTACEVEALRATEVLRWCGAECIQNGCSYDSVAQVYVVPVLATFTGVTTADGSSIGPGFQVYINEELQGHVLSFSEEEASGAKAEYAMGQSDAVGISGGERLWNIQLEELIPAGSPEAAEVTSVFELKLVTEKKTEIYYYCRWTSIRREFTREGLRRIRKGISLKQAEV